MSYKSMVAKIGAAVGAPGAENYVVETGKGFFADLAKNSIVGVWTKGGTVSTALGFSNPLTKPATPSLPPVDPPPAQSTWSDSNGKPRMNSENTTNMSPIGGGQSQLSSLPNVIAGKTIDTVKKAVTSPTTGAIRPVFWVGLAASVGYVIYKKYFSSAY